MTVIIRCRNWPRLAGRTTGGQVGLGRSATNAGIPPRDMADHLLAKTLLSSLYDIADLWKHRADVSAMRPTVHWRGAGCEAPL